ncbi:hypothetical protein, partial [Stenotrophomonas sp.]|uniref:hypothetical protein n=1 Tax=Stenotrophomonas sp. TaxID=69392 RepID=UPI003C64C227
MNLKYHLLQNFLKNQKNPKFRLHQKIPKYHHLLKILKNLLNLKYQRIPKIPKNLMFQRIQNFQTNQMNHLFQMNLKNL